VTIQQELAALKKEVTELRRISDLQKEKRRAKRARQKERKTQKEDPHSEEGQDKAEIAHTNAEGAGVVMSEENLLAHAECAGCEEGRLRSEACSGEGSEDSSLYAFSTWSREAERVPTPTPPPATPVKKKSRARSKKKRAIASDACSGDTGESQEDDAAAAAVVKLHGATWSDEEEEGDSDPAEMLRLLVDALNQQKEERKERKKEESKGKGKGKPQYATQGKNKGRGRGWRHHAASRGSSA